VAFLSVESHGVWRERLPSLHPGMADTYGCPLENFTKNQSSSTTIKTQKKIILNTDL